MDVKRIGKSSKPLMTAKAAFKHARRAFAGFAIALGLMAYAGGVAEADNLIADPTFSTLETSGSPWSLNNGGQSTVVGGPLDGLTFFDTACVTNCFDPINGSFVAQTITISEAGAYDFSLLLDSDLGTSPARTPNAVQVDLFPVGTPSADQTAFLDIENNTVAGWNTETTTLDIASTGLYVLKIYGEQVPGSEGVTDIDLEQAPTGTPEPSSALLLTAAGAVLLIIRRRRVCSPQSAGVDQAS